MYEKLIDELKKKLFCLNPADIDIETAMRLKHKAIPARLFKYRSCKINIEPDRVFAFENFRDDTAWFSSPDSFNDPYDTSCCFEYGEDFFRKTLVDSMRSHNEEDSEVNFDDMEMQRVEESNDSLLSLLKIAADKDDETITDDQIEEVLEVLNKFNDDQLENMNRKYSGVLQQGNKICCLCEKVDSMLMWSHYANNHKGFALEYNFYEMPVSDMRPRSLWPVIYENRLHDISLYLQEHRKNGFFNQFIGVLAAIHKAADWKYEKEWRLIYPLGTSHPSNNYSVPTPKALYLGSKISDGDKLTLTRIANEKNINIYEMDLSHSEFKMQPRKIS